jgi:hypothetical protein
MSSQDWLDMNNNLELGTVARGASIGFTAPSGGEPSVYAMHCLDGTAIGAVALHCNISNYSPLLSGGRVEMCIKRRAGASNTGFSPFIYIGCVGDDVNDFAYVLGLEDADPYRIVLRKGSLTAGIPAASEGQYFRRSSSQYQISQDLWHHIRLDMIVQPTGDVSLACYENDLSVNNCTSPIWQEINGMPVFVDDVAGINSSEAMNLADGQEIPLSGGYVGFGCNFQEQVSTRALFDHFHTRRQT